MEETLSPFLNGMLHGGFGVALIILGIIIGGPQTKSVLLILIRHKAKRQRRRAVTVSRHPTRRSVEALNRKRRGFVLAPILYILGMVGVLGGLFFSNYMQSIKASITIQNSLTTRNDMMAAKADLAMLTVLGADNMTLCPPRSTHQTTGEPCAAAPVGLIQFQDFPNKARLPTNYEQVITTGLPTEAGVFAVGVGVKQLDAFGHAYIYCRWENTRAKPGSPTYDIISAGADGILQTTCGDFSAQGDDYEISSSIAEVTTHASLWGTDGETNVSYGAAGTKVTIDSNGNITAAGTISALSAAITDGITASTVTATGDIAGQDLLASGTVSGATGIFTTLTASTAAITNGLAAATLTASGAVSGATGTFASMNATNAAITNSITTTSLTASGAVSGASGAFTTLNASNATITNGLTAASLTASSTVTGATGAFTTLNATNATVSGTATLGTTKVSSLTDTGTASIGGALTVSGTTNGSNASYTGTVTAASFIGAFSGSYSGTTLTMTGAASLKSLSASNNVTIGGTLGVAGYTTLAGLTASGITDTGDLNVAGEVNLDGLLLANSGGFEGTLMADSLIVFTSANVYESLSVGCMITSSDLSLSICQNIDSPIAFFAQYADADALIGISAPDGYGASIAFDEGTADYWSIGKQEEQWGRGFYVWDFTNQKNLILGLYPSGDLQLGEAASSYITASGKVGFGIYPVNALDASGNAAIGTGYAGISSAPNNGLIVQGNVGIGTTTPTNSLSFGGDVARTMWMERNPAANMAGNYLQVRGGGAASTATDKDGGNLFLTSGTATGTGGSNIFFQTATPQGSTNTSDNVPTTKMLIDKNGNVGVGTTTPAATLDVAGYMHLKKYSAAPATCSASTDGDIALTHIYTLCVCKSGTGWVTASTGSTSCTW